MRLSKRLNQPELIDLGPAYYTTEEYEDCLYQLDRIGRFLGGDAATYSGFNQLKQNPTSILDVGCGGGLFTMRLARRYPEAKIVGIDISKEAIQFARHQLKIINPPLKNIMFEVPPSPELSYPPESFDVVTSTLVCHHLSDDDIISFLKQAYSIAKHAIILNDLHRHIVARMGFSVTAPSFFSNRLIVHDGLLSIQRAFKKQDWIAYLKAARIPLSRCSITWHWAFRWIILINTSSNQLEL
jgi:2-polyprenyl-3-methyl-5-hydroxy-6-metoxy-1,4-benzoquinol methylase